MRRYWHCAGCGTRNERAGGRKSCANCGKAAPKVRQPKHMAGLKTAKVHGQLNRLIHGVDERVCAICGREANNRDHAHFLPYFPRGVLCWWCNKLLGEVERGKDGEAWLEAALAYVRRAREHHEAAVSA